MQILHLELGLVNAGDTGEFQVIDNEFALAARGGQIATRDFQADMHGADAAMFVPHGRYPALELGRAAVDAHGRGRDDEILSGRIVINPDQAFLNLHGSCDIAGKGDHAGGGGQFGGGLEHFPSRGKFGLHMAGQRQVHLRQLRQGEDVAGEFRRNDVKDAGGDGDGLCLAAEGGGELRAPGAAAVGDSGGDEQREAIWHAAEDEIGARGEPQDVVQFVIKGHRGAGNVDDIQARQFRLVFFRREDLLIDELEDIGGGKKRTGLAGGILLRTGQPRAARLFARPGAGEAHFQIAVNRAPQDEARADQLDFAHPDGAGEQILRFQAEGCARSMRQHAPGGVVQAHVLQPQGGSAGRLVALDDDAIHAHLDAGTGQLRVYGPLNPVIEECQRHGALRQPPPEGGGQYGHAQEQRHDQIQREPAYPSCHNRPFRS